MHRPSAVQLSALERTMMIPLWARAEETRKRRPIAHDPRALELRESVDFDFSPLRHAYGTQAGCVVRGLLYDAWTAEFLRKYPTGTVVELGAGLSTRYERLDNGQAHWVDIDLPDALALRSQHFSPAPRRTSVAASIASTDWHRSVREASPPYFFIAEGVLMYLLPEDVQRLFVGIADAFAPTELAFDSISPLVIRHQHRHDSMRHFMDAPFRWGVENIRSVEAWDPRLRVADAASLADVVHRFKSHIPFPHRLIADLAKRLLPAFSESYRLCKVTIGH